MSVLANTYEKFYRRLQVFLVSNPVQSVIVKCITLLIVYVVGLTPVWASILLWWLISPVGFIPALSLLIVLLMFLGTVQIVLGFLMFMLTIGVIINEI